MTTTTVKLTVCIHKDDPRLQEAKKFYKSCTNFRSPDTFISDLGDLISTYFSQWDLLPSTSHNDGAPNFENMDLTDFCLPAIIHLGSSPLFSLTMDPQTRSIKISQGSLSVDLTTDTAQSKKIEDEFYNIASILGILELHEAEVKAAYQMMKVTTIFDEVKQTVLKSIQEYNWLTEDQKIFLSNKIEKMEIHALYTSVSDSERKEDISVIYRFKLKSVVMTEVTIMETSEFELFWALSNAIFAKTDCFQEQYGRDETAKHKIREPGFLDEIIADNGALDVSFKTYKKLLRKLAGHVSQDPDTIRKHDQSFFRNFAQTLCGHHRGEALEGIYK
ncbi:Neprilysin-1 [Schistosoma japonicum]|uniref:Neprilysin-1 n=1 Tax=Schistosoma japonicum TaxID=6182 RepID=A0A4Z2DIG9_SCHJA|nr:Neprilysin-1 [Schistosoma japonicum]